MDVVAPHHRRQLQGEPHSPRSQTTRPPCGSQAREATACARTRPHTRTPHGWFRCARVVPCCRAPVPRRCREWRMRTPPAASLLHLRTPSVHRHDQQPSNRTTDSDARPALDAAGRSGDLRVATAPAACLRPHRSSAEPSLGSTSTCTHAWHVRTVSVRAPPPHACGCLARREAERAHLVRRVLLVLRVREHFVEDRSAPRHGAGTVVSSPGSVTWRHLIHDEFLGWSSECPAFNRCPSGRLLIVSSLIAPASSGATRPVSVQARRLRRLH